jgi:quercetin dioxygenase-like cupin family protein
VLRHTSRAASADALLAVPDMYRVELENEFVRVVRVRYPARSSGANHTHPAPGALIVPDVGLAPCCAPHP